MKIRKGIYVLQIEVKKEVTKRIGSLGKIRFPAGIYIYVGSAQNSLKARIGRHFKKRKKKFWHIDYLLDDKNVKIEDVFIKKAEKEEECKTARFFSKKFQSVEGFGSSDCKCKSHLFFLASVNGKPHTL